MDVPTWTWVATVLVALGVLGVDVVYIGRRPHEPSRREVLVTLAAYVGAAVVFGVGVSVLAGGRYGTEFFAGWLTEYSLSVDNLFIFLIIMSRFGVPRAYQQSALFIGIVLALVFRAVFIGLGAAAIEEWAWVFYLFGGFLVWTGLRLGAGGPEDEEHYEEGRLTRWVRRALPHTEDYHGARLWVRSRGRLLLTPMFVVTVALGTTDLLFAVDSIPAIYGLTQEPYLVLTANIFALMGLRQLYFLVGGLLRRLEYLSYGLAAMLVFIGAKLLLHALHTNELPFVNSGEPVGWAPEIPALWSLGAIVAILLTTTVVSLAVTRGRGPAERREDATL